MTRAKASPPPAPAKPHTRWGQERRLEFIDFRLRWDSRLNRADLMEFFAISVPQASLDIAKYLELAPENAAYDRSGKVYLPTESFRPIYPTNEPSRFLDELLARATGVLQPELSFLGWTPAIAVVPNPSRAVPVDTLVALLGAIRRKTTVSILYQSMSSTAPADRIVGPHALAHDGFRWHVRAYCHTRERFLDFVLARILGVSPANPSGTDGTADEAWHRQVRLVLAPNPALSAAHQRVIELDYGMTSGEVILECRQALLFYSLRRLGLLEEKPDAPAVQQILLKNRNEIAPFLPVAMGPR